MSGQISAPSHLTAELRNLLTSDFLTVRWRRQSYLTQLAVRKPREHNAWRQQTLINYYKLSRVRESLSKSIRNTALASKFSTDPSAHPAKNAKRQRG